MKLLQFETKHGTFFTCHNDIVFVDHLSKGIVFEEDIVFQHILPRLQSSKPKIVLDIGGHIGSHTVLYAKYIPNVTVHTFEPQSVMYQILTKNVIHNHLENVKTYHTAVGHKVGTCTMSDMLYDGYNTKVSYDTDQILNYGGLSVGRGGETVPVCTIDSLHLPGCDYIKIDVEGAEALVLLGALQTIRNYKPILFFEHTDKTVTEEMKEGMDIPKDQVIEDSLTILEKEGYQCIHVDGGNVLALPKMV